MKEYFEVHGLCLTYREKGGVIKGASHIIHTVKEIGITLPPCKTCDSHTEYEIFVEARDCGVCGTPVANHSYRLCAKCFKDTVGVFKADMVIALLEKQKRDHQAEQTDILLKGIHRLQDQRRRG